MRLAALYNAFNGLELLEKSIEQIYDSVDEVIIAYQTISHKGNPKYDVLDVLRDLVPKKGITCIEYKPDLSINTKQNEIKKLQLRIDIAKEKGCSHFFSAAEDHFYLQHEFKRAKNFLKKYSFDVTFTRMFTYYKHPTWQLSPPEDYYMPFICKLYEDTQVINNTNYPVLVDPSIRLNRCNSFKIFDEEFIMLHHFSMVRKDIINKFTNAAASIRWNKEQVNRFINEYNNACVGDVISYFKGRKLIEVDNYFNLPNAIST